VSYFRTSPLGRSVQNNDWRAFHEDTILKLLFDVANSPFNAEDKPLVLRSLENATGMDRSTVEAICRALEQRGLVELHPDRNRFDAARLTTQGKANVGERLSVHSAVAG
jgi:DNA-binding MarR family transcriptional regulator